MQSKLKSLGPTVFLTRRAPSTSTSQQQQLCVSLVMNMVLETRCSVSVSQYEHLYCLRATLGSQHLGCTPSLEVSN